MRRSAFGQRIFVYSRSSKKSCRLNNFAISCDLNFLNVSRVFIKIYKIINVDLSKAYVKRFSKGHLFISFWFFKFFLYFDGQKS